MIINVNKITLYDAFLVTDFFLREPSLKGCRICRLHFSDPLKSQQSSFRGELCLTRAFTKVPQFSLLFDLSEDPRLFAIGSLFTSQLHSILTGVEGPHVDPAK